MWRNILHGEIWQLSGVSHMYVYTNQATEKQEPLAQRSFSRHSLDYWSWNKFNVPEKFEYTQTNAV